MAGPIERSQITVTHHASAPDVRALGWLASFTSLWKQITAQGLVALRLTEGVDKLLSLYG